MCVRVGVQCVTSTNFHTNKPSFISDCSFHRGNN